MKCFEGSQEFIVLIIFIYLIIHLFAQPLLN
jgi:hypothetical protein